MFKINLTNLTGKIVTHIQNLRITDCGVDFNTIRISAVSLAYFTAEYCAPDWLNSNAFKKNYVQL